MKSIISIIIAMLLHTTSTSNYKIDFGNNKKSLKWVIVNDDVMGGKSISTLDMQENSIIFNGNISLENNGGFASFRTTNSSFDLSNYDKIRIRFKSDERTFALRLENHRLFFRPYFKHEFSSNTNDWEVVELSIEDFKTYRMGRLLDADISKDKLNDVLRIGLILNDKKDGPFNIEIDYIEFI